MKRKEINILILLLFVLIIVMYCHMFQEQKVESYVNNYYGWAWDHHTIPLQNNINNIYTCPRGNKCTFSMACQYTDDAMKGCYNSLDSPERNKHYNEDIFETGNY